jgi:hypothetical protein
LTSDLGDSYSVIPHESANYLSFGDLTIDVEIVFLVDPRRWSCNVPIIPS